jgi:D-arabinose 1-dehydrogenase-like Zn-dependent alcohol dehydrogenase
MRVAQVTEPNGPVEIVVRETPEPGIGAVRVKVEACGICHRDALTKEGTWPGIQYPRVPGHEIAGIVDKVGQEVKGWIQGQRVGIGWHGGHCGYCDSCRRGDFVTCQIALQIPASPTTAATRNIWSPPVGALARIPEGLSAVEAAPLMCAGVTTFNSLRNTGARPGDLVAILGIGARPFRHSVCGEDGVQDRCHCARKGERTASPRARRVVLHR